MQANIIVTLPSNHHSSCISVKGWSHAQHAVLQDRSDWIAILTALAGIWWWPLFLAICVLLAIALSGSSVEQDRNKKPTCP